MGVAIINKVQCHFVRKPLPSGHTTISIIVSVYANFPDVQYPKIIALLFE